MTIANHSAEAPSRSSQVAAQAMPARLCYFIMAHHKPQQFARLLAALYDPRDTFIVHVTARAPEATRRQFHDIIDQYPSARILPAEPVYWGHSSLARQIRRAIAAALERPDWEYFVILSGQCFPIKSKEEIRSYLSNPARTAAEPQDGLPELWPNYVSIHALEGDPVAKLYRRFRFLWILFAGRVWPLPAWRRPPRSVDFHWKGDTWAGLHRSFCEWLDRDPLPQEIWRFLVRSKHADEFWLQWCLMSGPFRETRRPYLHYIRWPLRSPHPEVLSTEHLPELAASDALFARKFDFDQDRGLAGLLEEKLLRAGDRSLARPLEHQDRRPD